MLCINTKGYFNTVKDLAIKEMSHGFRIDVSFFSDCKTYIHLKESNMSEMQEGTIARAARFSIFLPSLSSTHS